jgi:hypothetical protein
MLNLNLVDPNQISLDEYINRLRITFEKEYDREQVKHALDSIVERSLRNEDVLHEVREVPDDFYEGY